MEVNFDLLPDEILLMIFGQLSVEDIASSVAKVCSRWKNIIQGNNCLWKNAELSYDSKHSEKFIDCIKLAPCLDTVDISRLEQLSPEAIQSILRGCSKVKRLIFYPNSRVAITDQIKIINHFKCHLQILDMYLDNALVKHQEPDAHLPSLFSIIASMRFLKVLKLIGSINHDFYKEEFKVQCPDLEHLDVRSMEVLHNSCNSLCDQISFVSFFPSNKLLLLKRLSLPTSCKNVHDLINIGTFLLEDLKVHVKSIDIVKGLNNLKTLTLYGTPDVSYSGSLFSIQNIAQFSNIKSLALDNISYIEFDILTTVGSACTNLESLTIHGFLDVRCNDVVKIIIEMPKVKNLRIHNMRGFEKRHLCHILQYQSKLETLNLKYCLLSGALLSFFTDVVQKRMPTLKIITDYATLDFKSDSEDDWLEDLSSFNNIL